MGLFRKSTGKSDARKALQALNKANKEIKDARSDKKLIANPAHFSRKMGSILKNLMNDLENSGFLLEKANLEESYDKLKSQNFSPELVAQTIADIAKKIK